MRKTQIILARMLKITDLVIVDGQAHEIVKISKAPGRSPMDGERKLHIYIGGNRLAVKPNQAVRIFHRT